MEFFFRFTRCLFIGITLLLSSFNNAGAVEKDNRLNQGKEIYQENCRVCHGDEGNGKTFVANVLSPPPKNFTNPMVVKYLSKGQMVYSVTNGRPGTAMMPWKNNLTSKEIDTVVDYIRKAFMKS